MSKLSLLIFSFLFSCTCFAQSIDNKPFTVAPRNYLDYVIVLNQSNRDYKCGKRAIATIIAQGGGKPLDGTIVTYQSGPEMYLPNNIDTIKFVDGKAVIDMGTMTEPGFLECRVTFRPFDKTIKDIIKVAYEKENIKSFTDLPKDFRKFWNKTLAEAESINLNPQTKVMDKLSTDGIEINWVKLHVGPNNRLMYGWLCRPKDGKKHPVMFIPPGAGSSRRMPLEYYAKKGFISFNVEVHGLDPLLSDEDYKQQSKEIVGEYCMKDLGNGKDSYFKSVYAGCSRCIDYLSTLPDWDGKNIIVHGGSQGGALTIITAALNNKVTLLAACYPALCDLTAALHNRANTWPKYFSKTDHDFPDSIKKTVLAALPYYDVVNFARILDKPGYFYYGYSDATCSPTAVNACLNEIKSSKVIDYDFTNGHARFLEANERIENYILQSLK